MVGANLGHTDLGESQLAATADYKAGDLHGINLAGNTMTGWNLAGKDLTGADLQATDLGRANLGNATLVGVNLQGAKLTSANLAAANLAAADLTGADVENANLSAANLSGVNLTNASAAGARFANANLSGAVLANASIAGADFSRSNLTVEQLVSTANYQTRDLRGLCLNGNSLAGWGFGGQNLAGASFQSADLSGAGFTAADLSGANLAKAKLDGVIFDGATLDGADMRGAINASVASAASSRNLILSDGTINGVWLDAGESLVVRNSDIPIHIIYSTSLDPAATVKAVLDGNAWGSTISFDSGAWVSLAGTLSLTVDPSVDLSGLVGRSFQLFDWGDANVTGTFTIAADFGDQSGYVWDTSNLYSSGCVALTAVPEPGTAALLVSSLAAIAYTARRGGKMRRVSN